MGARLSAPLPPLVPLLARPCLLPPPPVLPPAAGPGAGRGVAAGGAGMAVQRGAGAAGPVAGRSSSELLRAIQGEGMGHSVCVVPYFPG